MCINKNNNYVILYKDCFEMRHFTEIINHSIYIVNNIALTKIQVHIFIMRLLLDIVEI